MDVVRRHYVHELQKYGILAHPSRGLRRSGFSWIQCRALHGPRRASILSGQLLKARFSTLMLYPLTYRHDDERLERGHPWWSHCGTRRKSSARLLSDGFGQCDRDPTSWTESVRTDMDACWNTSWLGQQRGSLGRRIRRVRLVEMLGLNSAKGTSVLETKDTGNTDRCVHEEGTHDATRNYQGHDPFHPFHDTESFSSSRIDVVWDRLTNIQGPGLNTYGQKYGQTCSRSNSQQYHAARNQFKRFLGFFELISRFEFDFRRCGIFYFLNDSNFWCVQSSITHNVAVHVPVLWLFVPTQFYFECCGVCDDSR